jgi:hypothetical protein
MSTTGLESTSDDKPLSYKRNWCLAKSSEKFLSERVPVLKIKINLPCPCSLDGDLHEWRCDKCSFYIDYSPKGEYFYCLCGAALTSSYSFKCSKLDHHLNNKFLNYDISDLQVQLENCVKADA